MLLRKSILSLCACTLLPIADAWQDEALDALSARVVDLAQLSPMRMLSVPPMEPAPTTLAEAPGDTPLLEGFELWLQEMPELLRRTAETGDATLRSPHGFTALQAACLAGDAGMIRALVQAGAPVNARPAERTEMGMVGESPLSLLTACTAMPVDEMLPLAQLLLEHGAEPDAEALRIYWVGIGGVCHYKKRYDALIFGARDWEPAHEQDKLDFLLLHYGEQDYAKRFNPGSCLVIPWWTLSSSVIRRLLEGGADPNARPVWMPGSLPSEQSKAPLLKRLVGRGDVENAKLALEHGAQVSGDVLFFIRTSAEVHPRFLRDETPYTPERAVELAQALLACGADIHARNGRGETLLEAYSRKSGAIAEALLAFFRERGAGSVLNEVPGEKATEARRLFLQCVENRKAILSSIESKESADEAACQLLAVEAQMMRVLMSDESMSDSADAEFDRKMDALWGQMYALTDRLKEKEYHGSRLLCRAVRDSETLADIPPFSEAEKASLRQQFEQKCARLPGELIAVHDRESADAAATSIIMADVMRNLLGEEEVLPRVQNSPDYGSEKMRWLSPAKGKVAHLYRADFYGSLWLREVLSLQRRFLNGE